MCTSQLRGAGQSCYLQPCSAFMISGIFLFLLRPVECIMLPLSSPLRNSPEHHPEGLHGVATSVTLLSRWSRWRTSVSAVSLSVTNGWCTWPRFLDGLGGAADQYVAFGSSPVMHICTQHSNCAALLSPMTHSNMCHGHTQLNVFAQPHTAWPQHLA